PEKSSVRNGLLGRLAAAQRQVPPPTSWPRLAGIESIQAFEAPETIQALIVGRDITGRRRQLGPPSTAIRSDSLQEEHHAHPRGILVRQFGAGQDRHRRRGG